MNDLDELKCALEYNASEGLTMEEVDKILKVVEGENDGPPWHWLCRLTNGHFAYVTGGCDYTGWD